MWDIAVVPVFVLCCGHPLVVRSYGQSSLMGQVSCMFFLPKLLSAACIFQR